MIAPLSRTIRVGETPEGTLWVTVSLGQTEREAQSVAHETIPAGAYVLSIVGNVTNGRKDVVSGQCVDEVLNVTEPADNGTPEDLRELHSLWERWHLNDMRAACAHQSVVWEDSAYGRRPSLDLTLPCPESGYRYGSDWLYEPLPSEVLEKISVLLSRGA